MYTAKNLHKPAFNKNPCLPVEGGRSEYFFDYLLFLVS